jgi:hypothetical protein
MTTAQRIANKMSGRTRGKDAIYTVVMDGNTMVCHTEATLDAWWAELAPEDKARLYELHLDGILGEEPSFTVCGAAPGVLADPAFVAGMSAIAKAARIMMAAQATKIELMMQSAREVLDAKGISAHV